MAATTVVHFEANVVEIEDEPRYRLYASCTEQGDLKDKSIFKMQITNPTDDSKDVFSGLVEMSDLDDTEGYKTNRYDAVAAGDLYWRSMQFAKYYENVDVAVQAKNVLKDEINRLIDQYVTYSTQYETSGEDLTFPTGDATIIDTQKATYQTALDAYNAAQEEQSTAKNALATAEAEYEEVKEWIDKKEQLEADLDAGKARLSDFMIRVKAFYGTGVPYDCLWIVNEIADFIAAYDADGSGVDTERDGLYSAKDNFSKQRATFNAVDIALGYDLVTLCNGMVAGNYYLVSDSDLATKENAVTAAQTAKVAADATVTATYAVLEVAYENVKAVCPSWTPDEPLPPRPSI